MSTLDERLRALRQARELLEVVTTSGELAPAIRDLAAGALRGFPSLAEIDAMLWATSPDKELSWGEALATARAVIDNLRRRTPGSDRWRVWAMGVDRHFPEASYLPGHPLAPAPWSATFLDPMRPLRSSR